MLEQQLIFWIAMSDAPWSKSDAEKWAKEFVTKNHPRFHPESIQYAEYGRAFLAGLAKAAEMIEASPTVYGGGIDCWTEQPGVVDRKSAKLVNVKPIEKGKSDE